jgi:GntR family transcriptional regulator
MFGFHLSQRSGVPYYVQLIQQVQHAVRFGLLKPGDQLPTVREVAGRLALNPNTVLRAYRDLQHEGLLIMRAGSGTFVAARARAASDTELYNQLRAELDAWLASARLMGANDELLGALFVQVLKSRREEVAR